MAQCVLFLTKLVAVLLVALLLLKMVQTVDKGLDTLDKGLDVVSNTVNKGIETANKGLETAWWHQIRSEGLSFLFKSLWICLGGSAVGTTALSIIPSGR